MLTTKTRRLVLGILLLLIVDIIWVLSSELTKYLYEDERYEKPFFCTYFKTSLFTLYLLLWGVFSPWKDSCDQRSSNYTLIDQSPPSPDRAPIVDNGAAEAFAGDETASSGPDDDDEAAIEAVGQPQAIANNNPAQLTKSPSSLSDSRFVPIKCLDEELPVNAQPTTVIAGPSATTTVISVAELPHSASNGSIKSVRFNRLAEVREMPAHDAGDALLARLSYAASCRLRQQRSHHKTARTALLFCLMWFCANYLFQVALEPSETALVTLLSSTSSIFTLVLAAIFPSGHGDRLTLSKAVAVLCSVAGVATITAGDVDDAKMSRGIVLALLSAGFYAAYLVLVKHKSAVEQPINIPLFFGFVGLWNIMLLWPVFFVMHFTRVELFEWPNGTQWTVLLVNGLIGTVLSEALWLWACFLTSSVIGTLAMTLQIPMAMLFDVLVKGKTFPLLFYVGALPMFASLVAVALLLRHDDGDPLLRFCQIVYRKVCHCRKPSVVRIPDLDEEQQESLIDCYEH